MKTGTRGALGPGFRIFSAAGPSPRRRVAREFGEVARSPMQL